MVIVHMENGRVVEIAEGVAIGSTTTAAATGNAVLYAMTVVAADGRVLAVFPLADVAGYDVYN